MSRNRAALIQEQGHDRVNPLHMSANSVKAQRKVHKVMGEFKDKTLRSSSGSKVTKRAQAIAIALSEARRAS